MIDICLITDNGYAEHSLTCIKSLKLSKNKASKYFVHVVLDVSEEDFEHLKNKFARLSCKNFDIECIKQSSEKYTQFEITGFHVKASGMLKFDLMNIFTDIDKLLYIDDDIVVKKDLSDLFNTDIRGSYFAANYHAPSPDEKMHCEGLSLKHVYNAGVMLMNLKKMREDNLYDKLIYTRNTNEYILKARSLDQLTFNLVCKENIKEFDPKHHLMFRSNFNVKLYNDVYHTDYKTFNDVIDDVTLIHFVGKDCKPWYESAKANDLWKYCERELSFNDLNLYNESNITELKPLDKNVIVFSFDSRVIDQAIVAIASMAKNTKASCHVVCLISPDVSLFNRAKIVHKLKYVNNNINISFVDIENVLQKSFDSAFVIRGITKPAYYRLFIDKVLFNFSTVIYSDIDVVFKKDVFDVFKFIKLSKTFAAVPSVNLAYRSKITESKAQYYFNSGFLVINVKRLKRLDKSSEVEELMPQSLHFQDQDILNNVFSGEIEKVPPIFCLIPSAYSIDSENKYSKAYELGVFTKEEINQLVDPYIVHYAGVKPWEDSKINMASDWQEYNDLVFNGYIKKAEETKQALKESKVTRTELANIIGKEHLIRRLSGIQANLLNLNQFKPSCVIRSFDFKKEVVFKSADYFDDKNKKKCLIDLKKSSPIIFVEVFMHGAIDVTVDYNMKVLCKDSLSYNIEQEVLCLSNKLFQNYRQFRYIDFLVVDKVVYFKRFRDE